MERSQQPTPPESAASSESSERPERPGRPTSPASSASPTSPTSPGRPGWPEIVAGLVGLTVVGIGGAFGVMRLGIDPVVTGLILTALSGAGGLAGFCAAYFLRLRSWAAFGVKRTSWRWIAIGAGVGVVTFFAKSAAILGYVMLTGDGQSPQELYGTGASGGAIAAIAATVLLGIVTPIGEEFLFRGVVTTALLRHGALVGVIGGAIIFAVFHGVNMVLPAALIVGLAAGEVYRRSGSIWPSVTVHCVVNLPTIPVMVLTSIAAVPA